MTGFFSDRNGYRGEEPEITVREDAPEALRDAIIMLAYRAELKPEGLRRIICESLLIRPDSNNWSDDNVRYEIDERMESIQWFKVYDIAESIYAFLERTQHFDSRASGFQDQLNLCFREHGVGWQMQAGKITARGSEVFAQTSKAALTLMRETGKSTAAKEISEALNDISRRPHADVTGAIQHAMAGLECIARDFSGNEKATLGPIIKNLGLPKPLDAALEKLWGFASEQGRHIQEGREPRFEEAELIVTTASAICTYLLSTSRIEA